MGVLFVIGIVFIHQFVLNCPSHLGLQNNVVPMLLTTVNNAVHYTALTGLNGYTLW